MATQPSSPTPAERAVARQDYYRFMELSALVDSPEKEQVTLSTLEEYQRLLKRFGRYTVDVLKIYDPDNPLSVLSFPILNTDCIPVPGTKPLVCPRSAPKPPDELPLQALETRFRSLQLVAPDETILWVGRGAGLDTRCKYRNGCTCFQENAPPSTDDSDLARRETDCTESPPATVQQSEGEMPAVEWNRQLLPALLSASDIADQIRRNRKSVTSFLTRHAEKYPDCRTSVDAPRKGEATYLYRVNKVWPAIEEWIKKSNSQLERD